MSHELRTPLNHIIGFTDLVVSEKCGPLTSKQKDYLGDVLNSSNHLLSLINDILDLAKVETGQMTLTVSPIVLKPFLEQSMTMILEKALKHRLQLNLDIEEGLTTIMGDERKLKQVLYNLLSNASKFTPDGGFISIRASLIKENKDQSKTANSHQEWVKIAITDSGIGLKSTDLDHIFHSFKQVDGSASRKYQGTGLGLALSRDFIRLHKGKIWAQSPGPNRGSTFTFTIPLNGQEPESSSFNQ